jgi:hypothetical protein
MTPSTSSKDDWRPRLWNIKEFTDITISCFGEKNISAHKIILSASSLLLHKLCSVSSKISLSEAPIKTVMDLLKFIYTGQVPTEKHVYNDFLVLAKKLEVLGLPALKPLNNNNNNVDDNNNTSDNGNNKNSNYINKDNKDNANYENNSNNNNYNNNDIENNEKNSNNNNNSNNKINSKNNNNSNNNNSNKSTDNSNNYNRSNNSNNQSKTNDRKRNNCQSKDDNFNSKKCKSSLELFKNKSNSKPAKKGLTDLPDEILIKILSYMKTPDVVVKVSQVSHRFNQLSNDPSSHVALHLYKQSTHYKTPELKQMLKFLKGKNKVKEVYINISFRRQFYCSKLQSSLMDSIINKTIVQQKGTSVIILSLTDGGFCTEKILNLLAQHPEKARQLHKIVLPCFRFDNGIPQPDFANLTQLEVYCSDNQSFDCLMRNASTLQRLESLKSQGYIDHSEFFAMFVRATGKSLKKLHLRMYKCSDQDFELMTSVCTQLQVLELSCDKVSLKNLQKIEDFQNLLDLSICVLAESFCHKVLSVSLKNDGLIHLRVSSERVDNIVIDLENSTELYLNLKNKTDVSKFLFSKLTKLELKYPGNFDQYSAIDELKHLTDLNINLDSGDPDLGNILELLDMVKRNGIQTFQMEIHSFSFCYKSNSFTLYNANNISQTEFLSAEHLSTLLKKLNSFNLEKLSLSCFLSRLFDTILQSIISLKTLKQLHLSLIELHYEEDNIAKTFFENLPNLKFLALNQLDDTDKTSDDVTWNMDENLFRTQRGKSTMFIPKKWIGGPSF